MLNHMKLPMFNYFDPHKSDFLMIQPNVCANL